MMGSIPLETRMSGTGGLWARHHCEKPTKPGSSLIAGGVRAAGEEARQDTLGRRTERARVAGEGGDGRRTLAQDVDALVKRKRVAHALERRPERVAEVCAVLAGDDL